MLCNLKVKQKNIFANNMNSLTHLQLRNYLLCNKCGFYYDDACLDPMFSSRLSCALCVRIHCDVGFH